MEKQGFHRWSWLVILLLGGLLMIYGGLQDVSLFFFKDLAPVPSWHPIDPIVGLICGVIIVLIAILTFILALKLKNADKELEQKLARIVIISNGIAFACDLICGYYGFGNLIALIITIWLLRRN